LHKPRLLIILNRLSVGGPASNTISAASMLCEQFDILLVAGAPNADEQEADYLLDQYKGFRVQKIASMKRSVIPGNDWQAYKELKKIIRSFQPQIVHTHGAKPGVLGRLAAHRSKVPVVIHTFHGHVFHSYFSRFVSGFIVRIERWLAGYSTALIAINQTLQRELIHHYRIAAAEKVKLIRLGIETNRYADNDGKKRTQFRNEFGLSNDEIAIGIVGRLVPVKQHRLFIEVADELLRTHAATKKLKFFIVGDGTEKKMLQELLRSKQLAYTPAADVSSAAIPFVFTSWRTDMDRVFAGLDIVVLTSLNEGTPVSLMEAMAAGKPVVSTNVGGIPELIEDGRTGLLAADQEGLVAQLTTLIHNPELRQQLATAAMTEAHVRLSKSVETTELAALYTSLLPVS
jgi:glycosyltransferase involved in cell wall biosynthesis